MSLKEIEQVAVKLPEHERIDLVCRLLETLPPPGLDGSDEELARRDKEMESGEVEPLSHEEFVRRVKSNRGK